MSLKKVYHPARGASTFTEKCCLMKRFNLTKEILRKVAKSTQFLLHQKTWNLGKEGGPWVTV